MYSFYYTLITPSAGFVLLCGFDIAFTRCEKVLQFFEVLKVKNFEKFMSVVEFYMWAIFVRNRHWAHELSFCAISSNSTYINRNP